MTEAAAVWDEPVDMDKNGEDESDLEDDENGVAIGMEQNKSTFI